MPAFEEPPELKDNPHGADFHALKDDGRRFRVMHKGVGSHREEAVVSARDLGPGAELPRLIRLGAITEMSLSEIRDHEQAQKAVAGAPVIAVVAQPPPGPPASKAALPKV